MIDKEIFENFLKVKGNVDSHLTKPLKLQHKESCCIGDAQMQ